MGLKLQKFVTSIGFKNWFIIYVLLQKIYCRSFLWEVTGSQAFVDNVKNLFKFADIDLSRCGSFGSCTEGKGGTEGFAGETADNTCTCHGHGNDRAVGELLGHFQRGT